jgi:hypothetical protein
LVVAGVPFGYLNVTLSNYWSESVSEMRESGIATNFLLERLYVERLWAYLMVAGAGGLYGHLWLQVRELKRNQAPKSI